MHFKLNTVTEKLKVQAGYSLLELTIVVLITGILAAVLIPDFSSTDLTQLNTITEKYASAMRFARSESIRTSKPYGFRGTLTNRRMRVARMDETTSPWGLTYDVYHPVSKKLYDFDLDDIAAARNIILTRTSTYRGTCDTVPNLYFDKNGSAWCADPDNIALNKLELILSLGSHSRVVSIDGITGRVAVQ